MLLKRGKESCPERKRDEQSERAGGEQIVTPVCAAMDVEGRVDGSARAWG